jgi:hypothetical protein
LANYTDSLSAEQYLKIAYNHFDSRGERRWIEPHLEASGLSFLVFLEKFVEKCRKHNIDTIKGYTDVFYYLCYGNEDAIIVDKTPTYGLVAQKLAEIFPGSKFIHLLRDGRIAATSIQKHKGFVKLINAGFPDNVKHYSYNNTQKNFSEQEISLQDSAEFWDKVINKIESQMHGISSNRQLTVRYEQIIKEPDYTIKNLIRFLELKPGFIHKFTMKHIARPNSLEKSYNRLSEEQFNHLSELLYSTLQKFGYKTNFEVLMATLKPRKLALRKIKHLVAFFLFVFFRYTKL